MTIPRLLLVLLGVGLGAVVYAAVGLILVAVWCRERIGRRCPRCRQRTLELIWWLESHPTPSPAYFECASCHARLSHVRPGPWEDASDPTFDKYYDGTTPGSINKRRVVVFGESDPSTGTYHVHRRRFAPSVPSEGRASSTWKEHVPPAA